MREPRLLLVVLVAAAAHADPPPSPVIFPKQRLPLSFSHQQHLVLPGVGCGTCHEDAAASERAADVLLPKEDACAACHEIDREDPDKQASPTARCDACHAGFQPKMPVERAVVPPPNLKFNHKLHAQQKIPCAACHDVQHVGLATRNELPRMALCLGCHDGRRAQNACTTCHLVGAAGRLRTVFPEGQLLPSGSLRGDAHDLRFRVGHARVAQNDERYCASCHSRAYCQDCHNGRQKPLDFHAGDYVALHALDARRQATNCEGCHRLQTFCVGCHSRSGVSDDPKTSGFPLRSQGLPIGAPPAPRFHPDGWLATTKNERTANDHAFQAQRNMSQCVSCHREELCRSCHATVNPHPPGWSTSSRCKALSNRAGRTCLRCHFPQPKSCS